MKYLVALVALIFAFFTIGAAVIAIDTGRAYWKPFFVERSENPLLYRIVIFHYVFMTVAIFFSRWEFCFSADGRKPHSFPL